LIANTGFVKDFEGYFLHTDLTFENFTTKDFKKGE